MTNYTKQIYDYEDDFDFRVPVQLTLSEQELLINHINLAVEGMREALRPIKELVDCWVNNYQKM